MKCIAACCVGFLLSFANTSAVAEEANERSEVAAAVGLVAAWLDANVDLPAGAAAPRVVFEPPARLAELRYGGAAAAAEAEVEGIYLDAQDEIHLAEGFDPASPQALSVLLHEMVHRRQAAAGRIYACPGAREAEAYAAQEAWLQLFGGSLARDFGVDPLTLLVLTACAS